MYSGSWNGFFSTPRFPCKYLRLWHQCLGTGTVFLYDFKKTSNRGSEAVTSCASTASGLATTCLSSATVMRDMALRCFRDSRFSGAS